jgi:hypothetical protein
MMTVDQYDEGAREGNRSEGTRQQSLAAQRSLEEHGVDITGAESGAELLSMQAAVDSFRRAAQALAGRAPLGARAADPCRDVVPPRAADETPRQYVERLNRMSERFRTLSQSPRERPR